MSKTFLLIIGLIAVFGCSSSKHAATNTVEIEDSTVNQKDKRESFNSISLSNRIRLSMDSFNLRIVPHTINQLDSDDVNRSYEVQINADYAYLESSSDAESNSHNNILRINSADRNRYISHRSVTDSENACVAKPPDMTKVFAFCGIVLIVIFVIRKHNG